MEWEGQALFEDPDFPSDDTSVLCDGSTPLGRLEGSLTWLRPQVHVHNGELLTLSVRGLNFQF